MLAHKAHNLGITGSMPTIPASYSLFMIYVSSIRIWYMNFFFFPLLQNRPLFQAICPGCLWARDNRWLLSRVQRLAGPAGETGPFVPVGGTNPDKRSPFCPGWWLHPGQKVQPLLSRLVVPTGIKGPFCPGCVTNPDKRPLHVIVQKGVILY